MGGGSRIRRSVWFSGRVQGVGFRYTAMHVARRFDVTGCVRNLADGRVEAVIEGQSTEIERYLGALREEMAGPIHGEDHQDSPATGEFRAFEVAY